VVVKCPYGEKKGFAVYCKVLRKKVSPLKYPCMGDYTKCPHYREATESLKKVESEVPRGMGKEPSGVAIEKIAEKRVAAPQTSSVSTRHVQPTSAFKPPELARTCEECMFYSSLTGYCMKLRIKVEDPTKPPCKAR